MNPNTLEFANKVVSRFLYNQDTPPITLADEALIRPAGVKGDPITVDTDAYMATVGRFALPSEFPIVQWFFNLFTNLPPKYDGAGNLTYYTKGEILTLSGISNPYIEIEQYQYEDGTDDIGVRTLIWNSTIYSITEDVRFFCR